MKLDELRAKSGLLQALTATEVGLFESAAVELRLPAGEVLFEEDGPADAFYIVVEGRIGLELTTPGKDPIVIQTLGPGDVLGWSWLIPPYTWHYDARALTSVSAIVFEAVCVREKCERDPVFGYEIYKRFSRIIARRLMASSMQLMDVYQ